MIKSTDTISEKAYFKYLHRGSEDGFDQQDWYESEEELNSANKNNNVKTKKLTNKNKKK